LPQGATTQAARPHSRATAQRTGVLIKKLLERAAAAPRASRNEA